MAVRDILIIPDKRLRLKSEPVKAIDKSLRALVDDMFETMYAAPGIGLAAIQIGVPQRVVTMDLAKKDDPKAPQVFINPEVVWSSAEKATYEEGCLSIPEYYEEVERPSAVKVKYLDLDGKPQEIEATGLLATCLQHEIDHTNGVLFIDHISKLKRDMVMKKFKKVAKKGGGGQAAVRGQRAFASYWMIFGAHPRPATLTVLHAAAPDLHGHARFRGADADRARRARARDRGGLYPRAKPAGRGMELQPSPVEREARRLGLPVLTPATLKSAEAEAAFRAHKADAAVVVAYGLILPKAVLEAPRLGCFNVHASLLPRWRGAAPINRAIMAGDKESGVTIMQMDEGLDTGAIVRNLAMAERVAIAPDMTAGDLHDALARLGADLMLRALGGAGARLAGVHAAARGRRQLLPPRSPRTKRASIGASPGSPGARPHPRPVAVSRRLVRDRRRAGQGAALDQGEGRKARPARCSTIV